MSNLGAGRNMAKQNVHILKTSTYFESLILFIYETVLSCLHTVSYLMVGLVYTGLDFASDGGRHLIVVDMVRCSSPGSQTNII